MTFTFLVTSLEPTLPLPVKKKTSLCLPFFSLLSETVPLPFLILALAIFLYLIVPLSLTLTISLTTIEPLTFLALTGLALTLNDAVPPLILTLIFGW